MAESNLVTVKQKIGKMITYMVLTLAATYTLAPLGFLLINSFKSHPEIVSKPISLPSAWDFNYIAGATKAIHFFRAFGVTLMVTVLSVGLIVLVSSLGAWIMVRNKTKLSSGVLLLFTAAMLIPFQSVMYPLLNLFEKIGLKNVVGLIFMYGGFGLSMSVFLYHGFFKSVPISIEEAAVIDGANIMQLFFYVVFPLVKSTTATVIILNSMWIWNDYLLPFLVIGNSEMKTLTLELYFAKITSGQYGNPWELIFPAVFVSIIPIMIIFLYLQKYIVKGVSDGALKQ